MSVKKIVEVFVEKLNKRQGLPRGEELSHPLFYMIFV